MKIDIKLGVKIALRKGERGTRQTLVGIIQIEYVVAQALLSEQVSIDLFVLLFVRAALAVCFRLVAWALVVGALAVISAFTLSTVADVEFVVVLWAHQGIVLLISCTGVPLLLVLVIIPFLALPILGLASEHIFFELELKLTVRAAFYITSGSLFIVTLPRA